MAQRTKAERALDALRDLSQFRALGSDELVHATTGARVVAAPHPAGGDSDLLRVTFPGSQQFEVTGDTLVKLMVVEEALNQGDSEDACSRLSGAAALEHLRKRH